MEDFEKRSIQTVRAISVGLFLLSDGVWYDREYVHKIRESSEILSMNDCEMGEEQGKCDDMVYAANRDETGMIAMSDRSNPSPYSASASGSTLER